MSDFKIIIGLEIHAQLNTKSKMFCCCDNDSQGKKPNTVVCPICLGMPGTLPMPNKEAILKTLKLGKALSCEIPNYSKFDRKHYYYPDLPKGYQISQYDMPLCIGGNVSLELNGVMKSVKLNRIHLEEDAGKLIHLSKNTIVDLNRAGTPLVEIVTEPVISSPAEAKEFMRSLQKILRQLNVSNADMEKGHLRCDANISVIRSDQSSKIIEIKNLNSFKFVEQALVFEERRLRQEFENWPEEPTKITRGFDSKKGITFEQRRKEEAADYRYFPEPDIPPIKLAKSQIANLKSQIKELPKQKQQRYVTAGIRPDVAEKLVREPKIAEYLESGERLEKKIALFVSEEVGKAIASHKLTYPEYQKRVPISHIADLLSLVREGMISKTIAKEVFPEMVRSGKRAVEIIKEKGLEQVSDSGELETLVAEIIKENPELVEKYKSGKIQVVGFFVGEIMKRTGGKANPVVVNKILKEHLDGINS